MPVERRGLGSRSNARRGEDRRLAMSLTPPIKVRKLQEALHAKAKGSPSYRFYLLYDKLPRPDVLEFAYRVCAANGGAAGVDDQGFRGHRVAGCGAMAGRTGGGAQREEVSTAGDSAGLHPEAKRR